MTTPKPPAVPDANVPDELLKGTTLLKVSEKKQKRALFRIDADQGQIVYESKKSGIIPIECIKEIRAGPEATYYRAQFKLSAAMDTRWITIVYILDGTYKTIHIVADTVDLFNAWLTALNRLHAVRAGLMTGLGNIEIRDAVWEKQYWKGADQGGDSKLDLAEIEGLCKRLGVSLTETAIKALFKEADTDKRGYLDFESFRRFVKLLKRRPDIEKIYAHLGKLDVATFTKFLHDTQKSSADAAQIFAKYSPNEAIMSLPAFTSFLLSTENGSFSELHDPVWQDMTRPMSEYYVSSSHNTYLVGHQLVGVSTIEGYIRALLHSCRSVEMDIYDGEDGEPVVYHGKTLTSVVPVREVCEAIAKYAFMTSPYAIIISAEVHCGIKQQDVIVEIMEKAFGDKLIKSPPGDRPELKELPSPEQLKGKILLKAKNLMVTAKLAALQKEKITAAAAAAEAANTSPSDSSDSGASILDSIKDKWRHARKKEKKQPLMSVSLAELLVYTVGVKCFGLSEDYAPEHIFSLSESRAARQAGKDMVRHTQTHMVRVYPKGTRVNSTNYQPQMYWAMGAQVVAINWQTFDLGYMINQAMFQRNGRCGYILKPDALRPGGEKLLERRTRHRLDISIISAQQLPRAKDSTTGREIIEKSTVDPLVHVALHVPDWMASPASDKEKEPITKVSAQTKVIKNNGFNPVWEEDLKLPFECVGGMMDMIFLEVSVRDDGEDEGAVAKYCIPLGSLGQGYRHLPLHDEQLSQYLFATLFVKVDLVDL